MPQRRFNVLPEEGFAPLRDAVVARVRDAARRACGESFTSLFQGNAQRLLTQCCCRIGADEGTVWLVEESGAALVPRFNSGPRSDELVGVLRQPLDRGMVSLAFASEQSICENDVYRNEQQDKTVDRTLGQLTCAMLAVPLAFGRELRGVISAVKLKSPQSDRPDPAGFSGEDLRFAELVTATVGCLLDARLLELCLGLEE
jgi:GAF domain-containing protein